MILQLFQSHPNGTQGGIIIVVKQTKENPVNTITQPIIDTILQSGVRVFSLSREFVINFH